MRKLSNMNRLTLGALLAAALLATGCRSTKATLVGRFAGSEARSVYLEQVTPLTQTIIDSAALGPDGGYKFRLKDVAATPSLYNLVCNGERIPLLIAGGDRLTVNAVGSVVRNYTVDGSEETELLRQFSSPTSPERRNSTPSPRSSPGRTWRKRSARHWARNTRPNISASAANSSASSSRTKLRWPPSTPCISGCPATPTFSTATAT